MARLEKKASDLYNSCNRIAKIPAEDYFIQQLDVIDCNEKDALAKINNLKKSVDQHYSQLHELGDLWKSLHASFLHVKQHQRETASPTPDRASSPSEAQNYKKGKEKQPYAHATAKPAITTTSTILAASTSSTFANKKPANASIQFFDTTTEPLFKYKKDSDTPMQNEPTIQMGSFAANLWDMAQQIAINLRHAGNVLTDPDAFDEDKEVALREIVDGLPMLYQHLFECSQDSNIAKAINLPELETIRHAIRHKMHCFLYAGAKDTNRMLLINFCNHIHKHLISPFDHNTSFTSTYFSKHLTNLYRTSHKLLSTHTQSELTAQQSSEAIQYELDFISRMTKRLAANYVYSPTRMRPETPSVEMQKDRFCRAICGAADAIGELSPSTDTQLLKKLLDNTLNFTDLSEEDLPSVCREIRNLRGHEINHELSGLIANKREVYLDLFTPAFIQSFANWAAKLAAHSTNLIIHATMRP